MPFQEGQRVVCVNDDWRVDHPRRQVWLDRMPHLPKRGRFYTIRRCEAARGADYLFGVLLVELVNPSAIWPGLPNAREGWFRSERFRPVVPRKTDISIFERIAQGADAPGVLDETAHAGHLDRTARVLARARLWEVIRRWS